jgi:hypothetical protein
MSQILPASRFLQIRQQRIASIIYRNIIMFSYIVKYRYKTKRAWSLYKRRSCYPMQGGRTLSLIICFIITLVQLFFHFRTILLTLVP